MRIALIQTDVAYGNPEANRSHLTELINKAMQDSPDVIVLPEMWNTGYALKQIKEIADHNGVPGARLMAELAAQFGVNIVAGSVADEREGQVYNTSYIYDRRGKEVARYSKVHLFGLMDEGNYLARGSSRVTFSLDGVECGIMICYDLRFPELARGLALDGAQVLFVPAQWPHPRLHPWRTLMQARAIENQVFTIGVNRVGQEGKAVFFGNSMVVDPLGEVVVQGSEKEEILIAEIDLRQVEKARRYMTCFSDRFPAAYS